jgi:hypothetical protein
MEIIKTSEVARGLKLGRKEGCRGGTRVVKLSCMIL